MSEPKTILVFKVFYLTIAENCRHLLNPNPFPLLISIYVYVMISIVRSVTSNSGNFPWHVYSVGILCLLLTHNIYSVKRIDCEPKFHLVYLTYPIYGWVTGYPIKVQKKLFCSL